MKRKAALGHRCTGAFDRFDERPCRERFGQVGDASCLDCRGAVGIAVIPGDEDDGQPAIPVRDIAAQLNPGLTVQIDVKNDAKGPAQIAMAEQCGAGSKRTYAEAVLFQQPFHAREH